MAIDVPLAPAVVCCAEPRGGELFYKPGGDVPAKPEREFQGAVDGAFSCHLWSVIEVALGIGILQVDRGRHHLVTECQYRGGQFNASSRSQ